MAIFSELDKQKRESLKLSCLCAENLAAKGDLESAAYAYLRLWLSIPDPKTEYEAAGVVLCSIGDVCYSLGFNRWAYNALSFASKCPGACDDPFLHMRFGQSLLDMGDESNALLELALAFKGGGALTFRDPEDQKYLSFLQRNLSA